MRNMQVRLGKPAADKFHESVERKMITLLESQEVCQHRQSAVAQCESSETDPADLTWLRCGSCLRTR